jgi:endonuclease-3 related protein
MFKRIYDILYQGFGPQNWWPVTSKNKKFEIILGTILTQNTSWKNVEKAIANLKKADLIDPKKIAKASKRTIARLIKPSGYFNQKAERLKIISDFLLQNKNLEKQSIKVMREKLLAVKGIGPETADSIILYAFNKPSFVIDSYTKRIFSRIGLCDSDIDYHNLQKKFHDALPKKTILYNEYHALIVELAKSSCSKKPVCDKCPVVKLCKKSL